MITNEVIKELYKNYSKPHKNREELNLPYHVELLKPYHNLKYDDMEVIVQNLDEFNPFRRFLIRSLHAVLEFDKNVAFVFNDHILFFSKSDSQLSVNFRPEPRKKGLFGRLFGKK